MGRIAQIIWYESIDSTNNEAIRHISELDNLSVLAAVEQTAGRGQRGNSWKSAAGRNLTFSIVLKFGDGDLPDLSAKDQFRITLAATLSVRRFLAMKGADTRVKWPNDIYAGRKKICGMLIENGLEGSGLKWSVIGIGINVNQKDFRTDMINAVSLSALTGQEYPLRESLEEFMDCFMHYLPMIWEAPSSLSDEYLANMYQKDTECEYVDCASGETFRAVITGVTEDARLRLVLPDGSERSYAFKEVSYVI